MTPVVLVYATRYALGRASGAAQDMETAIRANLRQLVQDTGCLHAMIRDIEEAECDGNLGWDIDRECWMRTLGRLREAAAGGASAAARGSARQEEPT